MSSSGQIILKNIGEDSSTKTLSLVHEVAHQLHYLIEQADSGKFSRYWLENHKTLRREIQSKPLEWLALSDQDLKDSGAINSYSEFDSTIDKQIKVISSGSKNRSIERNDLTLYYNWSDLKNYPGPATLIDTLCRDRENLSPKMAEAMSVVVLDPETNYPHFKSGKISAEFRKTTESIAVHTSIFTLAALFPNQHNSHLQRIKTEEKLKRKVEALTEYGFIKPEVANFLLDSTVDLDRYYGAGWNRKTVFPPFIGTISTPICEDITAKIDLQKATFNTSYFTGYLREIYSLNFLGDTYFSSTKYNNKFELIKPIRDFVENRSDLGIDYFFTSQSFPSQPNTSRLWFSGHKIKSAKEAIATEYRILHSYLYKKII